MAAAPGVQLAFDNADDWWLSAAMRALRWLADSRQPFETFNLTELGVPDPDHPNRWGALFRAAHTAGLIQHHGYAIARRPGRAGGLTRTWVGRPTTRASVDTEGRTVES